MTQSNGEETTRSWQQLEVDNAYLKQQNELLSKELSFSRYTIHALKQISLQKEGSLADTRQELERAYLHIHWLKERLPKPTLIQDNDLSDDLSEEDELLEKRPVDIMAKLPLRKPFMMVSDFQP
ncbi:hypothetical protein BY458DRAFT_445004 [Sporodiniella umbellata]|nr:hypothetical protein BY458DRAFT_445004 [Sporodiniella umbellata]